MEGRPPGLSIKAPNKTQKQRENLEVQRIKKEEEKQQKYAERREKLRLGEFENNNSNYNSNNNINSNNLEEINISRWTVIPSKNEDGGEFFEVPITPKAKKSLNKPPTLKRHHKKYQRFTNENYEANLVLPKIKRTKKGGKRRVKRKTIRRYK
jgi:hypothetical protein